MGVQHFLWYIDRYTRAVRASTSPRRRRLLAEYRRRSALLHDLAYALREDRAAGLHVLLAHVQWRDEAHDLIHARCEDEHAFFDTLARHARRHVFGMVHIWVVRCGRGESRSGVRGEVVR